MNEKQLIRTALRQQRDSLSSTRREEAETAGTEHILDFAASFDQVISYDSFGSEFSTKKINRGLIGMKKLFLPFVTETGLVIYRVDNLLSQTALHRYGFLEPRPELCRLWELEGRCLVIVPGIAFDRASHRLGYGKGYYDRFLHDCAENLTSCGLGFKEQYVEKLPVDPSDHSLDRVFLF